MKLQRDSTTRIEFEPGESNAARRLLRRLIGDHGFAACDAHGGFRAAIHGREYAIRLEMRTDGGCNLVAENPAACDLVPGIATGLAMEWRDPELGPTGRRPSVRTGAME